MKLLFLLLFPFAGSAQAFSLDKMVSIYYKPKVPAIAELKSIGFDKETTLEDRVHLKGTQALITVYFTGEIVDALEYSTLDSLTYASWPTDLNLKGFYYMFAENNYKTYASSTHMAIVYRRPDHYALVIMKKE